MYDKEAILKIIEALKESINDMAVVNAKVVKSNLAATHGIKLTKDEAALFLKGIALDSLNYDYLNELCSSSEPKISFYDEAVFGKFGNELQSEVGKLTEEKLQGKIELTDTETLNNLLRGEEFSLAEIFGSVLIVQPFQEEGKRLNPQQSVEAPAQENGSLLAKVKNIAISKPKAKEVVPSYFLVNDATNFALLMFSKGVNIFSKDAPALISRVDYEKLIAAIQPENKKDDNLQKKLLRDAITELAGLVTALAAANLKPFGKYKASKDTERQKVAENLEEVNTFLGLALFYDLAKPYLNKHIEYDNKFWEGLNKFGQFCGNTNTNTWQKLAEAIRIKASKMLSKEAAEFTNEVNLVADQQRSVELCDRKKRYLAEAKKFNVVSEQFYNVRFGRTEAQVKADKLIEATENRKSAYESEVWRPKGYTK